MQRTRTAPTETRTPTWQLVDLAKLPSQFAKHRSKLKKLAADHTIVVATIPAVSSAYHELFIAKKTSTGTVQLAALLVVIQ